MQKTVVVEVTIPLRHSLYGKLLKNDRRFKARDEIGVSEGNTVIIEESRPYSKEVHWKVVEKVEEEK
jgi:small subunit ribosomal protein S17